MALRAEKSRNRDFLVLLSLPFTFPVEDLDVDPTHANLNPFDYLATIPEPKRTGFIIVYDDFNQEFCEYPLSTKFLDDLEGLTNVKISTNRDPKCMDCAMAPEADQHISFIVDTDKGLHSWCREKRESLKTSLAI